LINNPTTGVCWTYGWTGTKRSDVNLKKEKGKDVESVGTLESTPGRRDVLTF
jgi:hypothetical protein